MDRNLQNEGKGLTADPVIERSELRVSANAINRKGATIDHWFIVGAPSLLVDVLYDPVASGDHDRLPGAGTDNAGRHGPSQFKGSA